MGRVYARGGILYLDFLDYDGVRRRRASGFRVGDEAKAQARLEEVEQRVAAHARAGGGHVGPVTLQVYVEQWLAERAKERPTTAKDEGCVARAWILPKLGDILLTELRPRQVRAFVRELRASDSARGTALAPKSVRKVYALLKRMLEDAKADELITDNPCAVRSGELPAKVDADPTWRRGAVFTREEAEALFSDPRVPEDRRTLNALLFLAGLRFGEAAALRWRDLEADATPLGRLHVATSWSTQHHLEKATKANRARAVPVHPALAEVLRDWRAEGWKRLLDRDPKPEDLIIPSRQGRPRNVNLGLTRFHEDQERLGQRLRRQHDARRTFISLALGAGASKDVLRWVTHGGALDVIDGYTTMPWPALCEAVSRLPLELRPTATPTPSMSAPAEDGRVRHSEGTAGVLNTKKPEAALASGPLVQRGGRDLNAGKPPTKRSKRGPSVLDLAEFRTARATERRGATPSCAFVPSAAGPSTAPSIATVASLDPREQARTSLETALALALANGDREAVTALAKALAALS